MLSGIYFSIDGRQAQVFRFYKDGTLLDVIIKQDTDIRPDDFNLIPDWLKREAVVLGVFKGQYHLANGTISFSTPGHFGGIKSINFTGKLQGDNLMLESLDHNTGRRSQRQLYQKIKNAV